MRSTWTQWSIESTCPIHVLPVLSLLLFPDPKITIVAGYFAVFCSLKLGKPHDFGHDRLFRILFRPVCDCCAYVINLHLRVCFGSY